MANQKKDTLAGKVLKQLNEDQRNKSTWQNVRKAKEVVKKTQKGKGNG